MKKVFYLLTALLTLTNASQAQTTFDIAKPSAPAESNFNRGMFTDAYTQKYPLAFQDWGATTVQTEGTYTSDASDKVWQFTKFNYLGLTYNKFSAATEGLTSFHFDLYSPDDLTVQIYVISRVEVDEDGEGNPATAEVKDTWYKEVDLTGGAWSGVDIALSEFSADVNTDKLCQFKIAGGNGTTNTLYVDNVYMLTTIEEVPNVLTLTYNGNSYIGKSTNGGNPAFKDAYLIKDGSLADGDVVTDLKVTGDLMTEEDVAAMVEFIKLYKVKNLDLSGTNFVNDTFTGNCSGTIVYYNDSEEQVAQYGAGATHYGIVDGTLESIIFPTSMKRMEGLFMYSNLARVDFSSNVTYIGPQAFQHVKTLKTVTFADNTNVTIGRQAFQNIADYYPEGDAKLTYQGEHGFTEKLIIGDNCTIDFGIDAFNGQRDMQITIGNNFSAGGSILNTVFNMCGNISNDAFNKLIAGTRSIGRSAFYVLADDYAANHTPTEIDLPATVSSIGAYAFGNIQFNKITVHGNTTANALKDEYYADNTADGHVDNNYDGGGFYEGEPTYGNLLDPFNGVVPNDCELVFEDGATADTYRAVKGFHRILQKDLQEDWASWSCVAQDAADVYLHRTVNGGWANTLTVPFALTTGFAGAVNEATNLNVQVAEFTGLVDDAVSVKPTLRFDTKDSGTTTANSPLLMKADAGASYILFENVDLSLGATGALVGSSANGITFMGNNLTVTDQADTYRIEGGAFWYGKGSFRGFRGWFTGYPYGSSNPAKASMLISVNSEVTSIDAVDAAAATETADKVYTLTGQQVGAQPQKGLYIVNGKKVVIK